MTKLAAPDGACKQIEANGLRFDTSRPIDVQSSDNVRVLRQAGMFVCGTSMRTAAVGYRCNDCGFLALFATCGRCGSENTTREE